MRLGRLGVTFLVCGTPVWAGCTSILGDDFNDGPLSDGGVAPADGSMPADARTDGHVVVPHDARPNLDALKDAVSHHDAPQDSTSPTDTGTGSDSGVDAACVNGTSKCESDTTVLQCENGKYVDGLCAGMTPACLNGGCVACTPGTRQCLGNMAQLCSSTGAWESTAWCSADGTSGSCGNNECIVVLATTRTPTGIAVDTNNVYWADNYASAPGVYQVAKSGGNVITLASGSSVQTPGFVAVDSTSVYWTDLGRGTVTKTPIGGGALITLAMSPAPNQIAVADGTVYWTDTNPGGVYKVPTSGGSAFLLQGSLQASEAEGIAVDSASVYWTAPGDSSVFKIPLGGGAVTTLANGQQQGPAGIAVDGSGDVFWVNQDPSGQSGVVNALPNGGTASDLALGQLNPTGIAVSDDGSSVYWTNDVNVVDGTSNSGSVMKVTGGAISTIASMLINPQAIAIDATSVYWVDSMEGSIYMATPR